MTKPTIEQRNKVYKLMLEKSKLFYKRKNVFFLCGTLKRTIKENNLYLSSDIEDYEELIIQKPRHASYAWFNDNNCKIDFSLKRIKVIKKAIKLTEIKIKQNANTTDNKTA